MNFENLSHTALKNIFDKKPIREKRQKWRTFGEIKSRFNRL